MCVVFSCDHTLQLRAPRQTDADIPNTTSADDGVVLPSCTVVLFGLFMTIFEGERLAMVQKCKMCHPSYICVPCLWKNNDILSVGII